MIRVNVSAGGRWNQLWSCIHVLGWFYQFVPQSFECTDDDYGRSKPLDDINSAASHLSCSGGRLCNLVIKYTWYDPLIPSIQLVKAVHVAFQHTQHFHVTRLKLLAQIPKATHQSHPRKIVLGPARSSSGCPVSGGIRVNCSS